MLTRMQRARTGVVCKVQSKDVLQSRSHCLKSHGCQSQAYYGGAPPARGGPQAGRWPLHRTRPLTKRLRLQDVVACLDVPAGQPTTKIGIGVGGYRGLAPGHQNYGNRMNLY